MVELLLGGAKTAPTERTRSKKIITFQPGLIACLIYFGNSQLSGGVEFAAWVVRIIFSMYLCAGSTVASYILGESQKDLFAKSKS